MQRPLILNRLALIEIYNIRTTSGTTTFVSRLPGFKAKKQVTPETSGQFIFRYITSEVKNKQKKCTKTNYFY